MGELKIGDIGKLADAVTADPSNPDVSAYLLTLGLDANEMESVKTSIADVNEAVRNPSDSAVPHIVAARWF